MSPSFSFGANTTAIPFIEELDRYSGGEGDKVVITGENFTEQGLKSYVIFSEYFDTTILSWTNERIEFVVPIQTEIANQLKNVLSHGPLKSVKTIITALPISFAGGDMETGNIVNISVSADGIESNKKEFIYAPKTTYPSWQKQLLNNGVEAAKDIFFDTPRLIGTISSYLLGSQDKRREMLNNWTESIIRPVQEFIVNPLSEKMGLNTQPPAKISKPLSENLDRAPESQPAQEQPLAAEVANDFGQQSALKWKTIEKTTFSVKITEDWEEIPSQLEKYYSQVFKFGEAESGNYFGIGVDPISVGGGCTDELWDIKINASGDGVIIEKAEDTSTGNEMCAGTHGDGKLNIMAADKWSQGIKPIVINDHKYDFFFGNSKKETGAETNIFKEILNSFRVKDTIIQKQTSPATTVLDKATAEKIILQALKANSWFWNRATLDYDSKRGTYSTAGMPLGFYYDLKKLEELGLITLHNEGVINFTAQAEPYLLRGQSGEVQAIVDAVPETVKVIQMNREERGVLGYSCPNGCYNIQHTTTYKVTPFGKDYKNLASKEDYTTGTSFSVIALNGACWEVKINYNDIVYNRGPQKVCL